MLKLFTLLENNKYKCFCGSIIKQISIRGHLNTKKHNKFSLNKLSSTNFNKNRTERQKHGFIFEDKIINYFGYLKSEKYNSRYDAYTKDGVPIQIKYIKLGLA